MNPVGADGPGASPQSGAAISTQQTPRSGPCIMKMARQASPHKRNKSVGENPPTHGCRWIACKICVEVEVEE